MLKIRISGSQKELEAIAPIMKDAEIKRYKHKKGKSTYAIDSRVTVEEFLSQNQDEGKEVQAGEGDNQVNNHVKNLKEIEEDLDDLLTVINEEVT